MAEQSLADWLNQLATSTQQPGPGIMPAPPVPAPAIQPNTQGWFGRAKDYVANTDFGALAEAMYRVNPVTAPIAMGYDAVTKGVPTAIANQRLMLGQLSRFPTDIVSNAVGLYPSIDAIHSLATGKPQTAVAETMGGWAKGIDEFGLRNWAEPIAGRKLGTDEQGNDLAGSLLRGTPAEMAGQWARLMSQAIVPVPSKVAAPIMASANMIRSGVNAATGGSKLIDAATVMAGKSLEVITPLAVSYSPSLKVAAANMAAAGVIGPASEAAVEALMPAKANEQLQAQADELRKQGSAQATAGSVQAQAGADLAKSVTPTTAGFSVTGDTTTDVLGAAAVAGLAIAGYKKADLIKRAGRAIERATTGYNSNNIDDQNWQTLGTKLMQQVGRGSESIYKTTEEILRTHGFDEKRIANMVGRQREEAASRTGAAASTKMQNWMFTGEYMDTPIKSKPLNDWAVEHNAATKAQQEMFAQAEWVDQELHLRQRMLQNGFKSGQSPLGAAPIGSPGAESAILAAERQAGYTPQGAAQFQSKYAHNLYDMTTRDLVAIRNAANADPVVQNLRRGFRDILNKAGDYMDIEKRFTAPQVRKFRSDNPNYVPPRLHPDEVKRGVKYLDPRATTDTFNPNTGTNVPRGARTFAELGNPAETLPSYMDEVFRSVEGMKTKRDFLIMARNAAAAGNPVARRLLGRELRGKPGADEHKFISWRDTGGNQRYIEINDAVVRDALKGSTSPTTLQMTNGAIGKLTQLYQSGAVGPLSLVSGTVFAPKSALYTATIGSALSRPQGVATGLIDRATQTLTGGAVGFRGIDAFTTLPIHLAVRAAGNVGAVVIERGARVLHNAVLTDGMLTKAFDPATLQRTADAAQKWYRTTTMYDMRKQGLMAPGSQMAVDPAQMYVNPAEALKGARGVFGAGGHFIGDILHAISASPAMVLYDVNKSLLKSSDAWKVHSAIRNLAGDPSASGAFKNAKFAAQAINATPWGNIYVQSLIRLGQSFKKDPGGTSFGLFNAAALPAIMATMWNNDAGPEYTQHQYFGRTSDQQAGNIYIAVPGRAANEGVEIPLDPLSRPFKHIGEALAGLIFGAFTGEMWKPGSEDERRMYKEMMHNRMFSFGPGSVPNSLIEQSVIPPVPGVAQAGAAAMGIQLRSYIDARATNARKDQGFAPGTEVTKGGGPTNPLDRVMLGHGEDILRGIGATAFAAVYQYIGGMARDIDPNAARFGNETKTGAQAAGTQFKEWKQKVGDSTAYMSGPLFGNFRADVPSQEAASQVVKEKLDGMKAVVEAYRATTVKGAPRDQVGAAGKFTTPEAQLGAHTPQPSVLEGSIASEVNDLYKKMQPTLSEIKKHHDQRQSLQNSNLFSPEMKRGLRELQGDEITKLNRRLLIDLQRAEQNMTNRYGIKIDFGNLKLQGGK